MARAGQGPPVGVPRPEAGEEALPRLPAGMGAGSRREGAPSGVERAAQWPLPRESEEGADAPHAWSAAERAGLWAFRHDVLSRMGDRGSKNVGIVCAQMASLWQVGCGGAGGGSRKRAVGVICGGGGGGVGWGWGWGQGSKNVGAVCAQMALL